MAVQRHGNILFMLIYAFCIMYLVRHKKRDCFWKFVTHVYDDALHMHLGQCRNNCVHGYACGIVILQPCRARFVLQLLANCANLCSDAYAFRAVWGSTQTRQTRRWQFTATCVSQANWCRRPTSVQKPTCRRFSFVLLKLTTAVAATTNPVTTRSVEPELESPRVWVLAGSWSLLLRETPTPSM